MTSRAARASQQATKDTAVKPRTGRRPAAKLTAVPDAKPEATETETKTQVTVELTALLVDGNFELHRSSCRDIAKTKRGGKVQNQFNVPVGANGVDPTEYAVVLDLWQDQISESIGEGPRFLYHNEAQSVAGYASATKFHDCTKVLLSPMPQEAVTTVTDKAQGSGNKKTPKATAKQAAKRELAQKVMAVVDAAAEGMTDTEQKTIAQWLHHLPVDHGWFVTTMKNLPKPDRSDWR